MDQNNSTIRTYMAIMAERDAAILERNLAIDERKRALAERDMAMLQRDAAISERNSAIHERNEAIAALQLQGPTTAAEEEENMHHYQHHQMVTDPNPEAANPRKARQPDESNPKRASKLPRVVKREEEESLDWLDDWGDEDFVDPSDEEPDKHADTWEEGLGLDHDVSAMPVPVCSCTGTPQLCYKWGNGGWQSACCTTTISMYPLPQASHKRYSRVGGRKMSGTAFSKLLSRLADEGYDLSAPLDLKDHWAKHGTNRYSTSK